MKKNIFTRTDGKIFLKKDKIKIFFFIFTFFRDYFLFVYKVVVFIPIFFYKYFRKVFSKLKLFILDLKESFLERKIQKEIENKTKIEVKEKTKETKEFKALETEVSNTDEAKTKEIYFNQYLEEEGKSNVYLSSLKSNISTNVLSTVLENKFLNKVGGSVQNAVSKIQPKNQAVVKTLNVGKTVTKKALQKENFEIFTEKSEDYRVDFAIIFLISLFVLYVLPLFDFVKPYMLEIYFLLCLFILFYCLHYFIIMFNDKTQNKTDNEE